MTTEESLSGRELRELVQRVFEPGPIDTRIAILSDLPDDEVGDEPRWRDRRRMALDWGEKLDAQAGELGLETDVYFYRNVRRNNADLPASAWRHEGGPPPGNVDRLDPSRTVPFEEIFTGHSILLAPTRFSTTAPLKLAARRHGFRAATLPGFGPAMIPALRLDVREIDRRVRRLAALLDDAESAVIDFEAAGRAARLELDLRHRRAHVSSGLLTEPGTAGNLPSGEAYIVPYEGELPGDPSRSRGLLPVELGGEVVLYRIDENRAIEVLSEGPESRREAELLEREPGYANLAELGLGVLAAFGIEPIGEVLLDEKLGLHIAFGRSDHFGGQVGATQFSSPEAVVHIDRVYLPQTQPRVEIPRADLILPGGEEVALLRDGRFVVWDS